MTLGLTGRPPTNGRRTADIQNNSHFSISRDGTRLLTTSVKTASVWEIASGRRIAEIVHDDLVRMAALSPDGRIVVTTDGARAARLWEADSGRLVQELSPHDGAVHGAQFGPSGTLVAPAADRAARLWDATNGQLLRALPSAQEVGNVQFHPSRDGELLVIGGRAARLWDLVLDESRFELPGEFSFSPDGDYLASTDGVWEAARGTRVATFHGPTTVRANSAAWSPDGLLVVTTYDDGTARIWAAGTNAAVRDFRMQPNRAQALSIGAVAFSPDASRVGAVAADGRATVWELRSGRRIWERQAHSGKARSVAFSPDNRFLATAGEDGVGRVWRAADGRPVATLRGHKSWVTRIAFSPDSTLALTQGYDGTARLWKARTGEIHRVLGGGGDSYCAGFDPAGRVVATCAEKVVRLWDVGSGRLIHQLPGHHGTVTDAEFSPDGQFVVTVTGGPTGDAKARVWEVETGRLSSTLSGVRAASFGSAGDRLLTIEDRFARIRLWRDGTTLVDVPYAEAAYWSPNGQFVLATDGGENVQLRSARTGKVLLRLRGLPVAATGFEFSLDGRHILVGGIDPHARLDGADFNLVRLYSCDICLPATHLLKLERQRATRRLTAAERRIYLH